MNFKIDMPNEVKKALNILCDNGFEAYIAGGCVRDSIIGTVPSDWDITTSAFPEEIKSSFKGFRIIETGLKHGTVTVIINNMQLEITTYRIDGEYRDNRRPESVLFTDKISLDLERRDFTINAMAYNENGLIDLNDGIKDINLKQIKCVGLPDKRFNEDGLRILRAMRFASTLNFMIEENTSKSIHKNKNLLRNISVERIVIEFNKLLTGENFKSVMIEYKDVISVFIPELNEMDIKTWQYTLKLMTNVSNNLVLRLTMLFIQIEKLNTSAPYILKRLKYDKSTIKTVKILMTNYNKNIHPTYVNVKKWLNKLGKENLIYLLKIKIGVMKSLNIDDEAELNKIYETENIMVDIIEHNQCYSLNTMNITGKDLIEIGVREGKEIGLILNVLLNKVIDEEIENNKKILIEYAKDIINNLKLSIDK